MSVRETHKTRTTMLKKIFRSKSLNLPKIRFHRRNEKDKRAQSMEYTSLNAPQFKWELPTSMISLSEADEDDDAEEPMMRFPCDVTFLEPHVFVVADSEGHKLDVFDLTREQPYCGSVGETRVWPNAVSRYCNDNSKVICTDRRAKEIKIFDVERGQLIHSWGSPWSDEDVPYKPHGVAMTTKKEIIVTETSAHCVHVYNKHGKLQHTFGKRGELLEQLCLPFYCSVDINDRILVSDNLNYSVKVFTSRGRQVAYMGAGRQENFGGRKLHSPMGVCADFDGNVLVCDNEMNRIVQYDLATAEYERDMLTRSSGGGLLSISKKVSDLAIPEEKKDLLNKASGCVAPCGIAVGPCGTLVYTECTRGHAAVKAYAVYSAVDLTL